MIFKTNFIILCIILLYRIWYAKLIYKIWYISITIFDNKNHQINKNKIVMNIWGSTIHRILCVSLRQCLCFSPTPIPLPIPKGNQYPEWWFHCYFAFSNSFYYKCILNLNFIILSSHNRSFIMSTCGLQFGFLTQGYVS